MCDIAMALLCSKEYLRKSAQRAFECFSLLYFIEGISIAMPRFNGILREIYNQISTFYSGLTNAAP